MTYLASERSGRMMPPFLRFCGDGLPDGARTARRAGVPLVGDADFCPAFD